MRKMILFMLVLLGGVFSTQKAQAWAVTDTTIADGYYYICGNMVNDASSKLAEAGRGVIYVGDAGNATSAYAGWEMLFIKPFRQLSSYYKNNLDAVFRIWRDKDGTYHIKNMGTRSNTYMYPHCPVGSQSNYTFMVGREKETYYFRTADWGDKGSYDSKTKKWKGYSDPWACKLDRQDVPSMPDANALNHAYAIADPELTPENKDSLLMPANKMFFIRPTSTMWRWRLGGSFAVKCNSFSSTRSASWYVVPVDIPDEDKAWMELQTAYTDALGMSYEKGNNPGQISSVTAMDTYNKVLDATEELLGNGEGRPAEEFYTAIQQLKDAVQEVSKYVNPLDGYYFLRNHYNSYGNGFSKYATPFNDNAPREYCTSGSLPGKYPDDTLRCNIRSHRWNGDTFWFGYDGIKDGDMSATTAEQSRILDHFIWKITPREDGSYTIKNCGESAVIGDSSYFMTTIKRIAMTPQVSAWCQSAMRGTPQQGSYLDYIEKNSFRITQTDNFYPLNMGNHHFNTQNPTNSMTYGLWDIFTVPQERITPKFKLNCAITDAAGVFNDWRVGPNPGQIKEELVAELRAELAKAREIYATGTGDMEAAAKTLDAVYQKTMALLKDTDKVQNPIEEGYYRFLNTDTFNLDFGEEHFYQTGISTSYGKSQSIYLPRDGKTYYDKYSREVVGKQPKYHMSASEDGSLNWEIMEKYIVEEGEMIPNPDYIDYDIMNTWHLTKAGKNASGKQLWYVQNVGTGKYLDLSGGGQIFLNDDPAEVLLDNNCQKTLLFNTYYYYNTNIGRPKGWYMIMDPNENYYLNCNNNVGNNFDPEKSTRTSYMNSRPMNTSSNLYAWQWIPERITGTTLDSLLAPALAKQRVVSMHDALADAEKALASTVAITLGDSLITETGWVEEGDTAYFDQSKTQIWMNQLQTTEKITITTQRGNVKTDEAIYMTNYNHLLDGKLWTYVHSRFNTAGGDISICTKDYNAILVDLKTPQDKIAFKYGQRGNASEKYGPLGKAPITYGVNDYGVLYRPTYFIVYGANESDINGTDTTWTEVSQIKNIPIVKDQRVYTSPIIESATPFRFYKFSVLKTGGTNQLYGHPHISPSYFQVFKASVDEANSPVTYDATVKAAADKVKALLPAARQAWKNNEVSDEQLAEFKQAVADLAAVVPDTMTLFARIMEAKVLRDSTYTKDNVEEQEFGDVTTGQKATFQAAIDKAEKALSYTNRSTKASLQAAYNELNEAYFTLNAEKKTFETDKWYYIVSTEYYNYQYRLNWAWRGNQMVYACGDIPQAPLTDHKMAAHASPVRWGHYTNFVDMEEGQTYPKSLPNKIDEVTGESIAPNYTGGDWGEQINNPYNMWRIVDMGDSLYAIQNRANGLYLGRRQDYTNGTYNYVTMSKEPMKVKIVLLGRGQYEILPADSTCGYYGVQADVHDGKTGKLPNPVYEIGLPLHSQGSDFHLVWWGTGTERGYNTGSAYTFKEINTDEVDETMLSMPCKNNSIEILSFPYDVDMTELGGFYAGEGEGTPYSLNNLTINEDTTTTIELTAIDLTENPVIKAGTPFILVTGEPEGGLSDSTFFLIDMSQVKNYSLKDLEVNGLQASLCGDSIKAPGYGIFDTNALVTTDSVTTAYIKGHSGYINPKNVVNLAGSADLTVNTNGVLDAIKQAVIADRKKTVNVYTTDGVLIKKGVAEGDAKNGLKKGNYIIGKYKVNINK